MDSVKSVSQGSLSKVPVGVFFYVGFACLFAYNMFLFELDMFLSIPLSDHLLTTYGGACNAGLVINILVLGKLLSLNKRMIFGSVLSGLTIVFIASFSELFGKATAAGALLLVTLALFAISNSTLQGALGAVVSKCPASAITAFSIGQAAAGVPTYPIGKLLAKLLGEEQATARLFIEFTLAGLLLAGIFPVFKYLKGESFLKKQEADQSLSTAESQPILEKATKMEVIKTIWPKLLAVWLSLFVTFVCLQGHFFQWGEYKMKLVDFKLLIWCFQIADTVGRLCCTFVLPMPSDAGIYVFTGVRLLLIPICFLVTFVKVDFLLNHVFCYIFAATLGFTLALNLTWGLVRGPQSCDTMAKKDVAGMLVTFALLNGIFVGSLTSNAIFSLISN